MFGPKIQRQMKIFILHATNNCKPYCMATAKVNIFGSKSGHLSNRVIARFFFIFSKIFAVFDDFPKCRVPNVLRNSEKSSNIVKNCGKMNEILQFLCIVILMAAFGNKNVHSALLFTVQCYSSI